MFKIEKKGSQVLVEVKLTKKVYARDKKIFIYAKEALRRAREEFPELELENDPGNIHVISNTKEPHEFIWKFNIKQKNKPNKNKRKFVGELVKSSEKPLTPAEEPATVEETSQSDQPAIVQEPTE
jgi:hypothetical protein